MKNDRKQKTGNVIMNFSCLSIGYDKKIIMELMDVAFENGKFISILGPNGAGKTTLLRTMARLLKPLKGIVLINGKPLNQFDQTELAKIVSVVLTDKVSMDLFSVFEFVALGRYPHTGFLGKLKSEDKKAVIDALDLVNAKSLIARKLDTLSDGEKQKVLLARALSQEPKLILLDEPTLHLDLKHRMEMMSILQNLCRKRQITVIASLHDVDIAARISDHVILVKNGRIINYGSPELTLDSKSVAELYDFNDASFNPELGSIEINSGNDRGKIFLTGGMGSGTIFYRLFARHGFEISTGVVHDNDIDCFVAKSLKARCITCRPMEKITPEHILKAHDFICQADCFVDTGFFTGSLNRANTKLVLYALNIGKPVLTLRTRKEFTEIFEIVLDNETKNPVFCKNIINLADETEKLAGLKGLQKNRQIRTICR